MKKFIVLFLAIFIIGTMSVSAWFYPPPSYWEIVNKDKDWDNYTYEYFGFSIDVPSEKVFTSYSFHSNKDVFDYTWSDKHSLDMDLSAAITLRVRSSSKYNFENFNDCTDEEFKEISREYRFNYLIHNLYSIEYDTRCEERTINGNRCIILTAHNEKLNTVHKGLMFVVDNQIFYISVFYRPDKWSEDFFNKSINSIKIIKTDKYSKK